MSAPILVAQTSDGQQACLLPAMANRHGLITGATGTGKTVTLQALAEGFSQRGVPVFLADVKGDLAGLSQAGGQSTKVQERLRQLDLSDRPFCAYPVTFWDAFGSAGHPIRTTLSELGPLLLARLLQLNDTQAGVLTLAFRIADDHGLLLLDLKDLRALLQYLSTHAAALLPHYGNISAASVGAIQRNLLNLENQGADLLLGEPALNLDDLLQIDAEGRGVINVLAADRLLQAPRVYATLLLWLLAELFEQLPEVGDLPQPKLVFIFDEAHLLFNELPSVLLERIEQVVRLIRSKGVGVFFVTQNPRDVPESVLSQLGNRVQHALRAFTPADQKAVRAAAQTLRPNPAFDTETAISELAVGEALVSCLDANGQPAVVQRAWVVPPASQLGPISIEDRQSLIAQSLLAGVYDQAVDRESAYERLASVLATPPPSPLRARPVRSFETEPEAPVRPLPTAPPRGRPGRPPDTLLESMTKSTMRTVGSTLGRELVRGLLGSLLGRRRW